MYKSMLGLILQQSAMKLESEKTISSKEHSGREYKFRGDSGTLQARSYLIGSSLYILLGVSGEDKDDSAEISRFLDSFRLTK